MVEQVLNEKLNFPVPPLSYEPIVQLKRKTNFTTAPKFNATKNNFKGSSTRKFLNS